MRRSSHAERLSPKQQTTGSHQLNNGGKRGRSGAGVSSPATGSSISERAVSQTSADSDGQDGWTVVKRKRRGRKQAGRQSATLAGDSRAKAEPRAPPQQSETETQPAQPLSSTPEVPPPTIKAAVQAIEEYLAVSGTEHGPRAMPVEQTELPPPTFSTGGRSEGDGGGSYTANAAVATGVGEG